MSAPQTTLDFPVSSIRAYLEATGWHKFDHRPAVEQNTGIRLFAKRWGGVRSFDLFALDGATQIELIIPTDERSSDYQRRVQDALRTLEGVEDRSSGEIASDILFINFDVIRSTLPNSHLVYEAVSLDSAIDHIECMRDLLSSSATTEISPRAFYGRVRKAAIEYSSRCLFGHTYKGSFGFQVQSPLTVQDFQPGLFEPEVPFERKVLSRLVNGLEAVKAAQDRNNLQIAMNSEVGLSANGYDILADLVENAGGQVSFQVAFSRRWQPTVGIPRVESFSLTTQTAELSRELAEKLRATYKPTLKTVIGRIINLRNTTDPSQLIASADAREVVVDFDDEDLGEIKVRILLNAADYLKALEAHKVGQPIAVDGMLERRGLRYVIEAPSHFRTL